MADTFCLASEISEITVSFWQIGPVLGEQLSCYGRIRGRTNLVEKGLFWPLQAG